MGLQMDQDLTVLWGKGTDAYSRKIKTVVYQILQSYEPQIANWMKDNAGWTDRTGNARQALWAEAQAFIKGAAIKFGHGVPYGKYLEVIGSGQYAIIAPALDYFAPKIWADIEALFGSGVGINMSKGISGL